MFRSIRFVYSFLEIVTLLIIIFFGYYLLILVQHQIRQKYLDTHVAEINKVDIIITGFLQENEEIFTNYSRMDDPARAIELLPAFSDIYYLDRNLSISHILKKGKDSQIFPGYNFSRSRLAQFLHAIPSGTCRYSPIHRSPENDKLSVYLAIRQHDGFLVGRMGLEKIERALTKIAQYTNSIIIIATSDGYILSNTEDSFWLYVMPDKSQREIRGERDYLYTREKSAILENDVAILTPMADAYLIISHIRSTFKIVIGIVLGILIAKFLIQARMLIVPLGRFVLMLREWEVGNEPGAVPSGFLRFSEISTLYRTFREKSAQISAAHESLAAKEDDMRRMQAYLKNIIDSMPSMLISVDEENRIREWNTAAVQFTGIAATDAIGRELWDVAPDFRRYKSICDKVISLRTFHELEKEIMHRGNERHVKKISFFPLIQNGVHGMAIRIDDITELEKIEQELIQSQKMETIGILAGGLAHDFNNVLGGIVGTLSLVKYKLKKEKDAYWLKTELDNYLATMEESANRATDIANQLLTLSRKQTLNIASVDLNHTVENVVKICRNTFDKSITITTEYVSEPAAVKGDATQLEQVTLNLCVNAAHAMTIMRSPQEIQGGKLTIRLEQIFADPFFCKSHPDAVQNLPYWSLRIHDTGVGMEPKTITKIFDPFFSTKDKSRGTGLGLSMAYNIVKLHKGFIDVYSELGRGTTFNVYLPVSAEMPAEEAEQQEEELVAGEGIVLVVDDEAVMRDLARDILRFCGYEALLAKDGEEAVPLFARHHQDIRLVILDMAMPRKSGLDTYRELIAIDANVKALIVSGFAQDDRIQQTLELGANGFIQKPYTLKRLSQAIARILNA